MSTLVLTILIASALILAALALLGLGWLITGKSKLRPGACGRDPTKLRDEEKDCHLAGACQLCEKKPDEKLR